ncbi:MAG: ABC transporter ATP-binding protein [Bacillota bacterium]|nr:ABC transporter ATP-binding protein [Bacillota bacterium]
MTFEIHNASKAFKDLNVLQDFSMEMEDHKIICIVGPSGAGKTTLLNIMSGVIKPDAGSLSGFADKTVSYLFQEPRLLPWKTVDQNIEFVLKDKMSKNDYHRLVDQYVDMVGLADFRHYYPRQLSGGMKQRVAIARAFAYPADLLLMDEPFDGLDPQLKRSLINAFFCLWQLEKRSVFFVTHDMREALLLGDKIIVLTDRPARIKGHIQNPIPYWDRHSENVEFQRIENQLNELVINPTC